MKILKQIKQDCKMEINSSNLYNKDILKTNKFENLDGNSLKNVEDKELRDVSNNFEAFFINQILETSLKSTTIAGEEAGSDIIKGMYLQSISDSSSGNFGISDMLYNFLSQNNKKEQGQNMVDKIVDNMPIIRYVNFFIVAESIELIKD